MKYTVEVRIDYVNTIYSKYYILAQKSFKNGGKKRKVRKYNLQKLKEQVLKLNIENIENVDSLYIEIYDNKNNLQERLKVNRNEI